jgi:hypothetical protein
LNPSISGDGRYVTFQSDARNLVPNDTNNKSDVFVRDRQTNTTTLVSIASDGAQGNGISWNPSISGNGQYIAFESYATNFVPADTNPTVDIFVADNPLYERLPTSASVASATGTGMITVSTSYGGIQSLTAVSQDELLCISLPGNVSFPHGLLSFTIANIPPGSTVTLTITFPAPIPEDVQFWKCQNGTWIDCTSLVGDDDGDEVLTLTITDGGLGDSDGQINGEISDPSGPAIPATAPVPVPAPAPMQAPSTPRASPRLPNPAQMSVQYISINPQQVYANQPVTILTNVVNTGGEAGNYGLALKINGKVEQNKMVSVGPQGAQPVKFTVTKAQPGIYIVDIGGQKGSFTIIGASHNGGSTSSGGVIAIIIVSILILATIVVLLISRRPA